MITAQQNTKDQTNNRSATPPYTTQVQALARYAARATFDDLSPESRKQLPRLHDHTAQLAFSHNAAAGRLLGLSESQIANAIAIAASSDASFAVIRAKPLSQWKGLASAQSALGAMNTLFLARRGVTGPLQVVEGPNGLDNLLHMQLRIDWEKQGYDGVVESSIKKYNAQIHTQSAINGSIAKTGAQTIGMFYGFHGRPYL